MNRTEVPAIRVRNLEYKYPDGTSALQGISFSVNPGEKIAIIGPNGAGKSTLLGHLNGILAATGTVEIFGVPVLPENFPEIRRRVGLVFQDPDDQLFCSTIFDDVAFGPLNLRLPRDEVKRRVREALQEVGLDGFESRSAFHLSGGEKKRVSLATVLSMDVEILVLDEPSANLDPRGRRSLIEWLRECKRTLLIATHDLDFAYDIAERALILHQGRLAADGPAQPLLADAALLEKAGLELPLRFGRNGSAPPSIPPGTE